MNSDRDIWAAVLLMCERYGAGAMLEAAARADQRLEDDDMVGAAVWHRILNASSGRRRIRKRASRFSRAGDGRD
jgi:hypothetical protein